MSEDRTHRTPSDKNANLPIRSNRDIDIGPSDPNPVGKGVMGINDEQGHGDKHDFSPGKVKGSFLGILLGRTIAGWTVRLLFLGLVIAFIVFILPKILTLSINSKERIEIFVSQIHGEAKFVVATVSITASLDKSEEYKWWIVYLGTTDARVRIDGCKLQYVISGHDVKMEDFKLDEDNHRLIVSLPQPRLDEEFIDIPSSPSQWWVEKSNGWLRWNKDAVEDALREEVRPVVLKIAKTNAFGSQEELVIRDQLTKTIREILSDDSLDVEISWRR